MILNCVQLFRKQYAAFYKNPHGKTPSRSSSLSSASLQSAATTRRILNVLPRRSTPELKCVDTTNGNGSGVVLSLNTTPLVTPLNLVQSGAGFYNRIGRRIEMKSLHLTGLIHSTGKQADQDYCRLLVVYDRQTNGAFACS